MREEKEKKEKNNKTNQSNQIKKENKIKELRLVKRDYIVLSTIDKWRVITGRQIAKMAGFPSQRTGDRRLKKLLVAGYIDRKKILYGLPCLYFLTQKGKVLISAPKYTEKIRIEQIKHDLAVVDTAIYLHQKLGIPYRCMVSEKQLHRADGFAKRRHRPDFVLTDEAQKTICAEIELSLKAKERLQKNVKDNFLNYDLQIWVVPSMQHKIALLLKTEQAAYNDIEILELSEVQSHE